MSRNFGAASPFGVTLKSKKTVRTNETVQAPFGVNLRKFRMTDTSADLRGNVTLKSHGSNKPNGSGDDL